MPKKTSATRNLKAELICVGTELVSGKPNTYPPLLSCELAKAGFTMIAEHSVRDSEKELTRAILISLKNADLVLVTGGLGPTFDDITREAAALALKRGFTVSSEIISAIENRFKKYRIRMPEMNKRQAMVIKGAEILPNAFGTAPAQYIHFAKKSLILLPGTLMEWKPMYDKYVIPKLKKDFPAKTDTRTLAILLTGMADSTAAEKLAPVMTKHQDCAFTILASEGLVSFHITVSAKERRECLDRLAGIKKE